MAAKKFSEFKPKEIKGTHTAINLGDYLLELGYSPSSNEKIIQLLSENESISYSLSTIVIPSDEFEDALEEVFKVYKENEFSLSDMQGEDY